MPTLFPPDLVLRVGFAGNRRLPEDPAAVEAIRQALASVFDVLETRVQEVASGVPDAGQTPHVTQFYSEQLPLMRLVTGLAEGADQLAADAWVDLPQNAGVRRELAAVLPFDYQTYRDGRWESHRPVLEATAAQCAYVLELDGMDKRADCDSRLTQCRQTRAYRVQAAVLLRHCDLLVAAADPEQPRKPGGTLETVTLALNFDLPVLFINTKTVQIYLLEPDDGIASLEDPKAGYAFSDPAWRQRLARWVTILVAGPDAALEASADDLTDKEREEAIKRDREFLQEFLSSAEAPPLALPEGGKISVRERCWRFFLWLLKPKIWHSGPRDLELQPYAAYRQRASALSAYYGGLYRGAFLLNYLLAVIAVFLATVSLVLIGYQHTAAKPPVAAVAEGDQAEEHRSSAPESHAASDLPAGAAPGHGSAEHGSSPLTGVLLGLALAKLLIVGFIARNTHLANHGHWNDKAIDYRYLAERLRVAFYLPRAGSFQQPAAAEPQFASRSLRQSGVDWLLDAILRHVSPARVLSTPAAADPAAPAGPLVLKADPDGALAAIVDHWIPSQQAYHQNNLARMGRMYHVFEELIGWLNYIVIGVVAVDMALLGLTCCGVLHGPFGDKLHAAAPWMIATAALLPAAVAALNGLRFQSECLRLADRSGVMVRMLRHWAAKADQLAQTMDTRRKQPAADPGSWTTEVLALAESCAADMVAEVADWSVVYAKDVVET